MSRRALAIADGVCPADLLGCFECGHYDDALFDCMYNPPADSDLDRDNGEHEPADLDASEDAHSVSRLMQWTDEAVESVVGLVLAMHDRGFTGDQVTELFAHISVQCRVRVDGDVIGLAELHSVGESVARDWIETRRSNDHA